MMVVEDVTFHVLVNIQAWTIFHCSSTRSDCYYRLRVIHEADAMYDVKRDAETNFWAPEGCD